MGVTAGAEAITLAVDILRRIAEDPLMRPSYRTEARGYLSRFAAPRPVRVVAEDDDEEGGGEWE